MNILSGVLLLAALMPSSGGNGALVQANVEGEVAEFLAAYVAKVNGGELLATLDDYADDPGFYWVEAGRMTYESKDDLRAAFNEFYTMVESFAYESKNTRITVLSATQAVITTEFDQTIGMTGNQTLTLRGVLTAVLKKGPSGWQFLIGHTTTLEQQFTQ